LRTLYAVFNKKRNTFHVTGKCLLILIKSGMPAVTLMAIVDVVNISTVSISAGQQFQELHKMFPISGWNLGLLSAVNVLLPPLRWPPFFTLRWVS